MFTRAQLFEAAFAVPMMTLAVMGLVVLAG